MRLLLRSRIWSYYIGQAEPHTAYNKGVSGVLRNLPRRRCHLRTLG